MRTVFLDDVTVEQVEQALGVPLTFVEQDGFALLDAMLGGGQHPKTGRGLGRAGRNGILSNTTPPVRDTLTGSNAIK